jgi:hypothetical protein
VRLFSPGAEKIDRVPRTFSPAPPNWVDQGQCRLSEPRRSGGVSNHFPIAARMTEHELERILGSLDAALAVYQKHIGALAAGEVSVKSMLIVVRAQVAEQLRRETAQSRG